MSKIDDIERAALLAEMVGTGVTLSAVEARAFVDVAKVLQQFEQQLSEGRTTDLLERIASSGAETAWIASMALQARAALAALDPADG